jgi:hypothetical protein
MSASRTPLTRLQSRYSARHCPNVCAYLPGSFVPAEPVYKHQAGGFGWRLGRVEHGGCNGFVELGGGH